MFAYAKTKAQISAFVFATWIVQPLFFLLRNLKLPTIICDCTGWYVLDLVGNPNCWFSHAQAHIRLQMELGVSPLNKTKSLDKALKIKEMTRMQLFTYCSQGLYRDPAVVQLMGR